MQSLSAIFRRNRTVILLFAVLVIMPSGFLGYLGFRAIRSDDVEQQFQRSNRQRQIALLLGSELKSWLFSQGPDGAASEALIRFIIDGDRVVFPDFHVSFAPESVHRSPVPGDSAKKGSRGGESVSGPDAIPNMREVEEVYYPRIQVFLRDFKLAQNSGAQYFRRLNAMIVQVPGTPNGYVLKSSKLMEFSTQRLDEMTASENFRGLLLIAEAGEPALGGEEVVSLNNFTFFHVAFRPKDTQGPNFRRNILLYSTILLTLITVLGGLFLHRAVSYEMAVVRLRTEFVSAVSHEFRTPLSSMLALLERLESGHVVEQDMLQRYHQTLRQEARRLGLLVDKLLDFAQFEERKKKLSFEPLDLEEIISEAISAFQQSSFAGRVERRSSGPGIPAYIVADRIAIIHCLQNLIENALKYSPSGAPVFVRDGLQDGAPFVEVIDHGIGIPVRDQQNIFEKFYRADNARALNVHGTGIGLALVKRIIEGHGGSVTVVSTPGKGSCFRLVFAKREGES
jgi:signal transduction histidine kinase